jgi:hypothetical protein
MARTYGAIYLEIWRDKDFRALSHTEQYVYWALVFQPQLNGAGLLDYMPSRWAEATSDMTTADVELTLKSLIAKRYVIHDASTHELLVRTYVRNSKVWKMPKAFAGVIPAAAQIQSSKLRRALLADLDKIPLGELSEAPGTNGGPSVRAKIDGYLLKLRAVLDDGEPDDPAGLGEPEADSVRESASGTERVSVPNAYGTDTDSANPVTSTRVRARAVPVQVPVQVPVPVPSTVAPAALPSRETDTGAHLTLVHGLPDEPANDEDPEDGTTALFEVQPVEPVQAKAATPAKAPRRAGKPKSAFTAAPESFEVTDELAAWAWKEHKVPRHVAVGQTQVFLDNARSKGTEYKNWTAAWRNWMSRVPIYSPQLLRAAAGGTPFPAQRQASDLGSAEHMARFRERQNALAASGITQPAQPALEVFPWDRTS